MPAPVLPFAFIESIGGGELMLVLVIALMLFGGDKLPELARGMGKAMREFKKTTGAMQDELRRAMEEVEAPPPTIMPPRPASPEIKSTPGIQPPGAAPQLPIDVNAEVPPHGSDPYMEHHDGAEPASAADTPPAYSPLPAPTPENPPVNPPPAAKPPETGPANGTGPAA